MFAADVSASSWHDFRRWSVVAAGALWELSHGHAPMHVQAVKQMSKHDLGIAGQFAELIEQIRKDQVNPIWARAMLQRMVENDHSADKVLLARTFLKLRRPSLREVADLLEIENKDYSRPFEKGAKEVLQKFNFADGPDEVEVVKVTARSVFEPSFHSWSERAVRQKTSEVLGLVPCPVWVVPAIAIDSMHQPENEKAGYDQLMVCFPEEEQKKGAFNVIHGPHWWVHTRSGDLDGTWDPVTWLMAKPY